MNKNEKKIYKIVDNVSNEVVAILGARNQKQVVRELAFSGYWEINRLNDTTIYDTGMTLESIKNGKEVDLKKVLHELAIEITEKAKEVDKEEMKKILKEKKEENEIRTGEEVLKVDK